jgi:glycosyltransferase involved in cell wall biosynthesis
LVNRPAELLFVGGYDSQSPYYRQLRELTARYGLDEHVRFLGKVPAEDLYGWYRLSDVFVCMSRHEGFGVPLLESMAFDLPVVACDSSSIADTLGGAGVLIRRRDFAEVAAAAALVGTDRAVRRQVVLGQRARLERVRCETIKSDLAEMLAGLGYHSRPSELTTPPRPEAPTRQRGALCE